MKLVSDYEPVKSVLAMHGLPRFGNSNKLADLLAPDESLQRQYVRGVSVTRARSAFFAVASSIELRLITLVSWYLLFDF